MVSRFTLQVRLADNFGDNAMIRAVICRPRPDAEWDIDTWLMSCRVLGRRVENMVLREMLDQANLHGISRLIGIYRPTDRNNLVEHHYLKLGFTMLEQVTDGTTVWALDVSGTSIEAAPMVVRSLGFATAGA